MQVVAEEQTKPREVELKIEVDAEQVTKAIDEVYREYARSTEVPGFRKGKAPRSLLERVISPESVKQRAVEIMVPPAYAEALDEKDIHPYADPDFEIVQFEKEQPFIFKASVPLPPTVELGEYKGIEVERKVAPITDEDVESQLKYLQESRTTTSKVEDRGIRNGDLVIADIASAVEGEKLGSPRRSLIEVGSNVPGFDENIQGMEAGQRRTFTVQYPEDHPDEELKGKNIQYDINVESVRERSVPELNDEFAKSMGDFETLDDLRADIRKHMAESAELAADREVEHKIVEESVKRAKAEFPEVMVEHEVHHDLHDMQERLDRQGVTFGAYLRQTGKTQEEFLAELREAASQRIRVGLVLGEIADKENIGVSEEDIDAEIDRMAAESNAPSESVESYLEARGGRDTLRNSLLNRKIIEFLKSVSTIKQ